MKTATFPSVCVEPELREAAEQSLQEGETLGSFVEQAIRDSVERRRHQREFFAHGMRSRDEAKRKGVYIKSDAVIGRLEDMLAAVKATWTTRNLVEGALRIRVRMSHRIRSAIPH